MRLRTTRTTGDRRFAGRLVLRLATLLGVLALATITVPQAQAIPAGDFYGVLQNQWTLKCADLPNYGSVGPNTPVTQYDCNSVPANDNQVWHFQPTRTTPQGLVYYKIQNVKSGLCLDLPNYGFNPKGTYLSVYYCAANQALDNQEWWFEGSSSSGYRLRNVASNGLCLDVANWAHDGSDLANGLPLTIFTCYNSDWWAGGYDDHLWIEPSMFPYFPG